MHRKAMSKGCLETNRTGRLKRNKKRLNIAVVISCIFVTVLCLALLNACVKSDAEQPYADPLHTDSTGSYKADVGAETTTNDATEAESSESDTTYEEDSVKLYTDRDVELIAKTVYGEALVTNSDEEMSAVAWCILNRVDSEVYPDTIEEVVTQRRQFHGYNENNPVTEHIRLLVIDVLDRWSDEKNGEKDVGRTLPKEYMYFEGDGRHNHFYTEYLGGTAWNWSLTNPYES